MARESEARVGCVGGRAGRSEVPEGAVVGGPDEGDAVEESFRGGGVGWAGGDPGEAVAELSIVGQDGEWGMSKVT